MLANIDMYETLMSVPSCRRGGGVVQGCRRGGSLAALELLVYSDLKSTLTYEGGYHKLTR